MPQLEKREYKLGKKQFQKINWVDDLKVVGILAVILGHLANPFSTFIYSWHMPLFFIISGFFINTEYSVKEFTLKNLKRLMIPYFIFCLVGVIAETVKRGVLHREPLNYGNEMAGVFVWMDMSSLANTYAFVLWFLPVLFFSKILFFLINVYIRNAVLQISILAILFLISFYIDLPFGIDNAFNVLIYLFIGHHFMHQVLNRYSIFFVLISIVIITFFSGIPVLDLATKYYSNIPVNIVWAVSVFYILYWVFSLYSVSNRIWKLWAANTLFIFIIHPYTNNAAHVFLERIQFDHWPLKYFISLLLLQMLLLMKKKYQNTGIFRYV